MTTLKAFFREHQCTREEREALRKYLALLRYEQTLRLALR